MAVHRQVFEGVFKFAGTIRDYNITKKERVLNGDTVSYLHFEDIHRALVYDIEQEKHFSYSGLSIDQAIEHIAKFISGLWQIHAFGEGNTRTTAVFCIQYLRSVGFNVDNTLFKNAKLGIDYNDSFLIYFFRNLLLGEHNELKNRYLHICAEQSPNNYRTTTEQVHTRTRKYFSIDKSYW